MATHRLSSVLHSLLHRVAPAASGEVSDAELLQRFVRSRDEAAFELLLWRHGPMVLTLCQRLLQNEQDAEDAFQATFLILVRKARTIGKREALASWLYKVAYRVACRARPRVPVACGLPIALEQFAADGTPDDVVWRDLRLHLDDELARLPETYRRPIILCYLEGKTHDEAARLLGWPKGTVATRLARGRERLRLSLGRRGWMLSSAALASVLTDKALAGAVSAELVRATLGGAVAYAAGTTTAGAILSAKSLALTEGVLRLMWYSKLKLAVVIFLTVSLASAGIGIAARQAWAGVAPDDPQAAEIKPANAQFVQFGGKKGASQAEIADLRREIATLRAELDVARAEINDLKVALRLPVAPPERAPLYRGRPARVWLEQMKDADASFRLEAVKALGALVQQQKSLVPVLLAALNDKDREVGRLAAVSLVNLGPEVVPALLEVVKDKTATNGRHQAIDALAMILPKAEAAVPLLTQTLKEEGADPNPSTINALGWMGGSAKVAVPVLVEALGQYVRSIEAKNDQLIRSGARLPKDYVNNVFRRGRIPSEILRALTAIDPEVERIIEKALPEEVRHYLEGGGLSGGVPQPDAAAEWRKLYDELKKRYPLVEK
jgi:RNA polymerase sigma factor (sigma-70 family)